MKLHVTDHAVLRWIERVYGIDLDKIRDEITAAVLPAATLGATQLSCNGVTIALRHNAPGEASITTVLPAHSPGSGRTGATLAGGRKLRRANSEQEIKQLLRRGKIMP